MLFVAFELSRREWKLALTSGFGVRPWLRTIAAGDLAGVARVIAQGRGRFGLDGAAPVVSCYEAGRDGFWIHRALVAQGAGESGGRFVEHRGESAGTASQDGPDRCGEIGADASAGVVWGADGVERGAGADGGGGGGAAGESGADGLTREQTRLLNQMRGWLATWGATVAAAADGGVVDDGAGLGGDGAAGAAAGAAGRASERLAVVAAQRAALDGAQQERVRTAPAESGLARLVQLKGVATTSAAVLLDEGLLWREFRNRREIGGFLGLRRRRMPAATRRTSKASVGPGIIACR